jgi:hypothetical protein
LSVISVGIKRGSRSGDIDKNRVRKYSVTYVVETDDKNDGPQTVLSAFGLPSLYQHYTLGNDDDLAALCISGKASEVGDGGKTWDVQCEFASDAIPKNENPLNDPVRYSLQWAQHEKVIEQDQDGNPIVNTVGDLFTDPPYKQDDSRPVLVATKNYPAADFASLVSLAVDYKDSLNTDGFYGASAGQVKLTNITTGDLQTQNEIDFYKVTYEFSFNPDGWQPEILSRGHRAKDADDNIYDLPNKEVRNLDEDGKLLGPDDEPYFIPFTTFPSRPFGALGV